MSTNATPPRPPFVSPDGSGGFRLLVRVQPGARRDETCGLYQDRLRIRLSAPAVDNKANKALLAFVARALGLRKQQVSLASGQTGRSKTLFVEVSAEPDWSALCH